MPILNALRLNDQCGVKMNGLKLEIESGLIQWALWVSLTISGVNAYEAG